MKCVVGLYKDGKFELVEMDYFTKTRLTYQKAEKLFDIKIGNRTFVVLGVKLPNGSLLIDPVPPSLLHLGEVRE